MTQRLRSKARRGTRHPASRLTASGMRPMAACPLRSRRESLVIFVWNRTRRRTPRWPRRRHRVRAISGSRDWLRRGALAQQESQQRPTILGAKCFSEALRVTDPHARHRPRGISRFRMGPGLESRTGGLFRRRGHPEDRTPHAIADLKRLGPDWLPHSRLTLQEGRCLAPSSCKSSASSCGHFRRTESCTPRRCRTRRNPSACCGSDSLPQCPTGC